VLVRRRKRVFDIEICVYAEGMVVSMERATGREREMEIESERVYHLQLTSSSPPSASPCSDTAAAVNMFAFHRSLTIAKPMLLLHDKGLRRNGEGPRQHSEGPRRLLMTQLMLRPLRLAWEQLVHRTSLRLLMSAPSLT
jgi:hypothetical protein